MKTKEKRFKFPKKVKTIHYPIMGARIGVIKEDLGKLYGLDVLVGDLRTPTYEEILEDLGKARKNLGNSKTSRAKYVLEMSETGDIWTEIVFQKV